MRYITLYSISLRPWLTSLAWIVACVAYSQDLEPRALSMVPTGGNFAVSSYAYSNGNILIDENIPIEDLTANLHSLVVAYLRSFKLFNRVAKFDAVLPYSLGKWNAIVSNRDTSTSRSGLGDPMARISMILIGGPTLSPGEFAQHDLSRFRLGVFFRVRVPLGEYNNTKLINLGSNRWAFKTGVGVSYRVNKFVFEAYANAWLFTDNKEFLVDNVVSQATVLTFQGHVTYLMKKGKWLAISLGQSGLGETQLNDIPQDNTQNSWKFGIAFALPLTNNQTLKFAFTNGLSTKFGADFNTLVIAYQFMWFDKAK
jgi:outer membrane putative beta-barrel porin/alpha-amylase